MQTEEILVRLWGLIQTFGGTQFTSTVKTRLDQDRDITINFNVGHLQSTPLLDDLPGESAEDSNLPGRKARKDNKT